MLKISKTFSKIDLFQLLPKIFMLFIIPNIFDLLEFVQSKNVYLSIGGNHEQNNQTDRLCER